MKKLICALLLAALLALPVSALAAAITEATLIYEDYDGDHVQQTVTDQALLAEIQAILARAKKNPVGAIEHTMNCTLMCVTDSDIVDFAVATDGSAFVVNNATEQAYAVNADDMDRLWAIYDRVDAGKGIEADEAFEDW